MPDESKSKLEDDIDLPTLQSELKLLKNIQRFPPGTSLRDLCKALTPVMCGIYTNVARLLRLYLTVLMSNASAERSFSCLRRLKSYRRNRLTHEHLNHRAFLHVHKDLTDQVELISVCQDFVLSNDRRINYFGKKFIV